MSIEVMTLVFKRSLGSVTRKAVLLAMADAANDDGSGVWKSAETIASQCDVSKRSVLRTWKELESDGLIRRTGTRSVRGGEVIVWGLDCEAIRRLKRAGEPGDKLSSGQEKPGDTVSLGDILAPGDMVSPGDNRVTNPVTIASQPGDTVSPKPSYNHPINHPARERAREDADYAIERIMACWSVKGRKRSHSRKKLAALIARKAKTYPLEKIVHGAIMFAKMTDHDFHPGLQVFLNGETYENWQPKTPEQCRAEAEAAQPSQDALKAAVQSYVRLDGVWDKTRFGPPPHSPECQLPASTLAWIADRLGPQHRYTDSIRRNAQGDAA